jgi:hypothetical protein
MQDAVGLIGNTLIIDDITYVISNVQFVPDSHKIYITLSNKGISVNYELNSLLPYIIKQIKL